MTQEKNDQAFDVIFRFGMIPLFLFSGTFFPVAQLPAWIRPLAYVDAAVARRGAVPVAEPRHRGRGRARSAHIGYLVAVAVVGLSAGQRTYRRRLYV